MATSSELAPAPYPHFHQGWPVTMPELTRISLILSFLGVAGKRLPVLADEGGNFMSILPLWSGNVIHFYAL